MNSNTRSNIDLRVDLLVNIFGDSSTSYKYLFFIGLLDLVNRTSTEAPYLFCFGDIIREMLVLGWYPRSFCKLSFGRVDQIGSILDKLKLDISSLEVNESMLSKRLIDEKLRPAIDEQFDEVKGINIDRYVFFRLLAPFFDECIRGLKDSEKNQKIREKAEEQFETEWPPIYKFSDSKKGIVLHCRWVDYLNKNMKIIRGWALHEWIGHLQKRNPNVPAIISKIEPPSEREGLVKQRKIWKKILEQSKINEKPFFCIYTNTEIDINNFVLDHFIPWSFVCHDQFWNLIPVDPKKNGEKGRFLPRASHIKKFIEFQSLAIMELNKLDGNSQKIIEEEYCTGLSLDADKLRNRKALRKSYNETLKSLVEIAQRLGFQPLSEEF